MLVFMAKKQVKANKSMVPWYTAIDTLRPFVANSPVLLGQTHVCYRNVKSPSFVSLVNLFRFLNFILNYGDFRPKN